jgi:hypothetical protein
MATPNEASLYPGNGQMTSAGKKKANRKGGAVASAFSTAKSVLTGRSETMEILFSEEPNPFQPPAPPYIWIDHPTQNETLQTPGYSIRLGVGGADLVEISIDKSPWLPCRLTSGYWWYDWTGITKGKHTLVARMRTSDGRWYKTPPRPCNCKPE